MLWNKVHPDAPGTPVHHAENVRAEGRLDKHSRAPPRSCGDPRSRDDYPLGSVTGAAHDGREDRAHEPVLLRGHRGPVGESSGAVTGCGPRDHQAIVANASFQRTLGRGSKARCHARDRNGRAGAKVAQRARAGRRKAREPSPTAPPGAEYAGRVQTRPVRPSAAWVRGDRHWAARPLSTAGPADPWEVCPLSSSGPAEESSSLRGR